VTEEDETVDTEQLKKTGKRVSTAYFMSLLMSVLFTYCFVCTSVSS